MFAADGTRVATTDRATYRLDSATYRLDTGQEFPASDPTAAAAAICSTLETASGT